MDTSVIAIYVVCDEVIKMLNIKDDVQTQMSTSEVTAFAILASKLFYGNHRLTRWVCKKAGYFPKMLSESRLNRRLHKIPWNIWIAIFRFLALVFKAENSTDEFCVDSFPIACCAKQRIDRRKFLKEREYLGYSPSKKKYFCGVKVHMIVTGNGQPVEFAIRPASNSDVKALWGMEIDLPTGSRLYADGAYNCYDLEDVLLEDSQVHLLAKRKQVNSKRKRSVEEELNISSRRQAVETAFSCITRLFPRSIHVSTSQGFLMRVMGAILAYSIDCLL